MSTLEPLCNFEQSKMLKKLKFNENTQYCWAYDHESNCAVENEEDLYTFMKDEGNNDDLDFIACPTISLARNWLYEKYKLFITVDKFQADFRPKCLMDDGYHYIQNNKAYPTPNEAESDCLTEVLKKLISEQQVLRD